jgi:hypothetical protein
LIKACQEPLREKCKAEQTASSNSSNQEKATYILSELFNDDQYEYRYDSCSSGCESKKIVGEPKSTTGGSDMVLGIQILSILDGERERFVDGCWCEWGGENWMMGDCALKVGLDGFGAVVGGRLGGRDPIVEGLWWGQLVIAAISKLGSGSYTFAD